MPRSNLSALLTAVRTLLVVAGVGVAAAVVYELATMPPPPPNSDGFAHGMAGFFGGLAILVSLGVAAVSVVLPSLLGREDPLGFDRRQRLALRGAGVLLGGGLLVGLAYGSLAGLLEGLLVLFLFVALGAVVVGATLVWRLGEVAVRLLSRVAGEGAP